VPLETLQEVILSVEEMEALRLAHAEGHYQEAAAREMGISRQTFGRLLETAHQKITKVLCEGLALRIAGGTYHLQDRQSCPRCRGRRSHPTHRKEHPMRIAIPTMDGKTLSQHFGHSRGFLVLDMEQGNIRAQSFRENDQAAAPHAHEQKEGHPHSHGHGHGHHDHNRFVTLLGDCQTVLVGGIGAPARRALESAGLQVILVRDTLDALEAATRFAKGELIPSPVQDCGHHA
jgi:predicted DNA-binding protein (UPF0251 family)/predicted Fe-Mo cluster-binding NifX family protein